MPPTLPLSPFHIVPKMSNQLQDLSAKLTTLSQTVALNHEFTQEGFLERDRKDAEG